MYHDNGSYETVAGYHDVDDCGCGLERTSDAVSASPFRGAGGGGSCESSVDGCGEYGTRRCGRFYGGPTLMVPVLRRWWSVGDASFGLSYT